MSFTDSVEFLAAALVIVIAGVLLGLALSRGRRKGPDALLVNERLRTYIDLLATIDGLRAADGGHKRKFIRAYQRTLIFAPDTVVRALDRFVQQVAADHDDPAAEMEARDDVVLAIRQDALAATDRATVMQAAELLSIEVDEARPRAAEPVPEPPLAPVNSPVAQPIPEPAPVPAPAPAQVPAPASQEEPA